MATMILSRWPKTTVVLALLLLTALLVPDAAHAAGAGGLMPWDTNLQKISQSFTGVFAYSMTIIGLVGACIILLFAQEIPYFLKAVCFVVLVGSLLMGANAFANTMGWTGAIV